MKSEREVVHVGVSAAAIVGLTDQLCEAVQLGGTYDVECVGPREEDRARYIDLRDAIAYVEQELPTSEHLAWLRRELDAIPLEHKWKDTICNLVTTVGKNNLLDNHLAGSSYTAAWFMGLIGATSYGAGPAAGDTSASHAGWVEATGYSAGTRPAPSFSAASGGSKATSSNVSFSINATETMKGCFLISNSTKGGTTGVLYSAGLFTGGDQPVVNGNTLNVSYTASA